MTTGPRIGSLFTGWGGLDQAVHAALGGETVWVSDIDPGACKVLAHRYPHAPNLGDITTVDWSTTAPVDIVAAGFPCQDVSGAGKQAGLIRGTRTGLWYEVVRCIEATRPRLVILENVRGIYTARGDQPTDAHQAADRAYTATTHLLAWVETRHAHAKMRGHHAQAQALAARRGRIVGCRKRLLAQCRRHESELVRAVGTVLGDLARLGFDAEWCGLPASGVGAPHKRFRWFLLAWPTGHPPADTASLGHERSRAARDGGTGPENGGGVTRLFGTPRASDAKGCGPVGSRSHDHDLAAGYLGAQVAALLPTPTAQDSGGSGGSTPVAVTLTDAVVRTDLGRRPNPRHAALLPTPTVNDMGEGRTVEAWDTWTAKMRARHGNGNGHGPSLAIEAQRDGWGTYGAAVTRWETHTRPAPPPTINGRLNPAFSEWMMGAPPGWFTDTPGVTRPEALKLAGNGVVPQQGTAAILHLLERTAGP